MHHDDFFIIPFTNPVLIFFIILVIVLFSQLWLKRLNVPSVVGLILAGVFLGPNGLGILARDSSIILLGTVGLLYIMFLAAVEIDLVDFKKNRHRSLIFGLFTFSVPMILGTLGGYYLLGLNFISSLLLGSMFGAHTLISYPIATQLGITKSSAVSTAVGGTVITDSASLLVLAVITASVGGELGVLFWTKLLISTFIFGVIIFWLLPKIAYLFFTKYQESIPQYIFVLAMVFLSASLADFVKLEPIIGAFAAGLVLNRFIPHNSPLMNRIEFIGNAIFIPFFLIGVGMIVDLKVFFISFETIWVSIVLIVITLVGKYLAAVFTQKTLKLDKSEGMVIYGLSVSQAAVSLAVVFVGYKLNFFDETILNGTIVKILVTCLVSSLIVEKWGQKIADKEANIINQKHEEKQKLLLATGTQSKISELMNLAVFFKDESDSPIYALKVVKDNKETEEQLHFSRRILEDAVKIGSATENQVQIITRIAPSIGNGIIKSATELMVSDILLVWDKSKSVDSDKIFGNVINTVVKKSKHSLIISCLSQPLNTFSNVTIAIPPRAELEEGFLHSMMQLKTFSKKLGLEVNVMASNMTLRYVEAVMNLKPSLTFKQNRFDDWTRFDDFSSKIEKDELLIVFSARVNTISWSSYVDTIPSVLEKLSDKSFLLLYQKQTTTEELQSQILKNRYKEIFGGNKRRVRKLLLK